MATIMEAEKAKRYQNAMEGLYPDPAVRSLLARYAEGELTLNQFSSAMQSHARKQIAQGSPIAGAA